MSEHDYFAHPTAVVEDGARSAAGTKIWHHGHIRTGARIGANCVFGKNVSSMTARIGDRCKIQNNVSVYHGVIDRRRRVRRAVGNVHQRPGPTGVQHRLDDHAETTVERARRSAPTPRSCAEQRSAEFSMVAAGATVTRSVQPHQLVAGTPARHLGWVCDAAGSSPREVGPPADTRMRRLRREVIVIPITAGRKSEPEEEALVLEVLRSGQLAQGAYRRAIRGGVRRQSRRSLTHRSQQRHDSARRGDAGLDLRPGDEVITSPFTFVATLNAILEAGATARFVGHRRRFQHTPRQDRRTVKRPHEGDHAGPPLRLDGRHGSDHGAAAQHGPAPSSRMRPRRSGPAITATVPEVSGIGCFSLYATKNLNTGEGGVVTTNDDAIADRLRLLRNQGMRQRYQYEMAGHNYRLTNLAAAVGIPQIDRIAEINERRAANAKVLPRGLARHRWPQASCCTRGRPVTCLPPVHGSSSMPNRRVSTG